MGLFNKKGKKTFVGSSGMYDHLDEKVSKDETGKGKTTTKTKTTEIKITTTTTTTTTDKKDVKPTIRKSKPLTLAELEAKEQAKDNNKLKKTIKKSKSNNKD